MDGNVRIEIGPEEAAALYAQFCEDYKNLSKIKSANDADSGAVMLAIARERERCAKIAEGYIKENGDWSGMAGEISLDVAAKIRGGE